MLVASVITRARSAQPNSLLISDDLSELRLSDEEVLQAFRNVDFLLITLPQDVYRFERICADVLLLEC